MTEANRRLRPIPPSATPEEAAAIVAAIERFVRASAPAVTAAPSPPDAWQTTAILEGVSRDPRVHAHDPWTDAARSLP